MSDVFAEEAQEGLIGDFDIEAKAADIASYV